MSLNISGPETESLPFYKKGMRVIFWRNCSCFCYQNGVFTQEQMEEATLFLAAPTSSNVFKKKKNLNNVSPPWSLQRIHTIVRD